MRYLEGIDWGSLRKLQQIFCYIEYCISLEDRIRQLGRPQIRVLCFLCGFSPPLWQYHPLYLCLNSNPFYIKLCFMFSIIFRILRHSRPRGFNCESFKIEVCTTCGTLGITLVYAWARAKQQLWTTTIPKIVRSLSDFVIFVEKFRFSSYLSKESTICIILQIILIRILMGRRKSKRKPPPKRKNIQNLEKQFDCPLCNHELSCDVLM